ncbi:hypothetical protein [Dissulfurispira sp.]|uniref:hypothetical protein n=1 Tax=Dissulfurispira sp. TaxID=2817609 RepID=UPI002FD98287
MVIFDASTLILLAKIDMLELFISSFQGKVLMPESVALEVGRAEYEDSPLIRKLLENKKISILKVKNKKQPDKLMSDFNIDKGEAEAISLAIQENIHFIATDDRNAIRACKMLKIEFITAIALLIRAYEKKLIDIDEALAKLQKLKSTGRYSESIIIDAERHLKGGS